jgi:hypothetical protein
MALYNALPCQFGAALRIQDEAAFKEAYGCQIRPTDKLTLLRPSPETLSEWAKSCLGIGAYEGMHSCGGWSPFRSGHVLVEGKDRTRALYYKLGDDNCWDFHTTCPYAASAFAPWLEMLQSFVRIALAACMRDREHRISPSTRVQKMLFREWGAAGDDFTLYLGVRGFDPCKIEEMVRGAWRVHLNLPVPAAFAFVTNDEATQARVLDVVEALARSPKGLRV